MLRALVGLAFGAVVGALLVGAVVVTKFGPLVNTPRSVHGLLIVVLIVVPAIVGAAIGGVRGAAR